MMEKLKKPHIFSFGILFVGLSVFVAVAITQLKPRQTSEANQEDENEQLILSSEEENLEIPEQEITATPYSTQVPTRRPTLNPSPTVEPSITPIPTVEPSPTNTPQATATNTPEPTKTPTLTQTPTNTPTPSPTDELIE